MQLLQPARALHHLGKSIPVHLAPGEIFQKTDQFLQLLSKILHPPLRILIRAVEEEAGAIIDFCQEVATLGGIVTDLVAPDEGIRARQPSLDSLASYQALGRTYLWGKPECCGGTETVLNPLYDLGCHCGREFQLQWNDIHGIEDLRRNHWGVGDKELAFLLGPLHPAEVAHHNLVVDGIRLSFVTLPLHLGHCIHHLYDLSQLCGICDFQCHLRALPSSISRKACTRVIIWPVPDAPYSILSSRTGTPCISNLLLSRG